MESPTSLAVAAAAALLLSIGVVAASPGVKAPSAAAEPPYLSPRPQELTWGIGTVDTAAPITAGIRGDMAVARWADRIPAQAEGYYLSVAPQGIVIAAADSAGLFYARQTLAQLLMDSVYAAAVVRDWPSMGERGVVEGFYGNPYSHEARLRLFEFMGRNKMNVFVYGPKDDPYHRSQWRMDYPPEEGRRIAALVRAARRHCVKFVWAVHPGGDIRWERSDSVALVRKCEAMYRLGVRSFCVFFDDISGEGTRGDKQAGLLNYLTESFVRRHADVDALMMCPTQYNRSWSHGDYLATLGTRLDASVRVMWTGATVVDMVGREDMEWVNAQLRRKAYVWLNYPVNDYCIDHLLMGPTWGNGLDIAPLVSGFCANPMEYCEASKVSLFSIADYTWNTTHYDAETSWLQATAHLVPAHAEAFRLFCDNNVDLGPTAHGLRREAESAGFTAAGADEQALGAYFSAMARAATELEHGNVETYLWREIEPWVLAMRLTANRGLLSLMMSRQLIEGNKESFVKLYEHYASMTQEQEALRSRDFRGSIKVAQPAVASRHIEPWLRERVASLIASYKERYDYRLEVFPQQVLANGTYLIRDAAGRYLTDPDYTKPGAKATFARKRNTVNPQTQEWTVAYDAATGRYAITNNQARRYLNELGAFGTNAYDREWNTYEITRDDASGRFAIRNGGRSGRAWWLASPTGNAIIYADETPAAGDMFTWSLEPVE